MKTDKELKRDVEEELGYHSIAGCARRRIDHVPDRCGEASS